MEKQENNKNVRKKHISAEHARSICEKNLDNQENNSLIFDILKLIIRIFEIATVCVIILTFVFGITKQKDISMSPSIMNGDLVIFYRLDKIYKIDDIIVVEYEGKDCLARVVAVANDVVNINESGFTVNGNVQQRNEKIKGETLAYENKITFPVTCQEGEVFVLGDNRENATDSRVFGAVNIKNIKGKVFSIIRLNEM